MRRLCRLGLSPAGRSTGWRGSRTAEPVRGRPPVTQEIPALDARLKRTRDAKVGTAPAAPTPYLASCVGRRD